MIEEIVYWLDLHGHIQIEKRGSTTMVMARGDKTGEDAVDERPAATADDEWVTRKQAAKLTSRNITWVQNMPKDEVRRRRGERAQGQYGQPPTLYHRAELLAYHEHAKQNRRQAAPIADETARR